MAGKKRINVSKYLQLNRSRNREYYESRKQDLTPLRESLETRLEAWEKNDPQDIDLNDLVDQIRRILEEEINRQNHNLRMVRSGSSRLKTEKFVHRFIDTENDIIDELAELMDASEELETIVQDAADQLESLIERISGTEGRTRRNMMPKPSLTSKTRSARTPKRLSKPRTPPNKPTMVKSTVGDRSLKLQNPPKPHTGNHTPVTPQMFTNPGSPNASDRPPDPDSMKAFKETLAAHLDETDF